MISLIGGVFRGLTALEEKRVLVVGLDGSGKSTYVNQLKLQLGKPHAPRDRIKPTMGLNVFTFELDKKRFTVWDIAGGPNYRKVWHSYLEEAHALVFLLDGSAPERLEEARQALRTLLADERVAGKPVQFYVNKSVAVRDAGPAGLLLPGLQRHGPRRDARQPRAGLHRRPLQRGHGGLAAARLDLRDVIN